MEVAPAAAPVRPPRIPLASILPKATGPVEAVPQLSLPRTELEPQTPTKAKKRPPCLGNLDMEEPACAAAAQTFQIGTPRKDSENSIDVSSPQDQMKNSDRHYIGTPRAEAILSAFLSFDDDVVSTCGDVDREGPPLDFDKAFAAFKETQQSKADSGAQKAQCGTATPDDDCDSSGSTSVGTSDNDRNPAAACENRDMDDTDSDEEDVDEDDRSEYYESDFETESSEEEYDSEDEEEDEQEEGKKDQDYSLTNMQGSESKAENGRPPPLGSDFFQGVQKVRGQSRGAQARSSSRAQKNAERSCSRPQKMREHSSSRPQKMRDRSSSRPQKANRSSSRAGAPRAHSRGCVQRIKTLDQVLDSLSR